MAEQTLVLPDSLEWVNTQEPPTIAGNQGRVLLLVFWSYANINSRHMMALLREFETKYESSVAIIGIHTPRFEAEESVDSVLKAVNRWGMNIPVATDVNFASWQQFGIQAWPSVLVLDAQGRPRKLFEGDNQERPIELLVDQLLTEASAAAGGVPLTALTAMKPEAPAELKFPSQIIGHRNFLYVSDSGNHRVLELSEDGRIRRVFGSGHAGLWDGYLDNAGFNSPTGLAYTDNTLYVADTGNHCIRKIKLMSGEVETIAGSGHPGRVAVKKHIDMRRVAISSPVGLALRDATLFLTAAGMNQIWRIDLDNGAISWLSGSGQNTVRDGAANQAGFALPLGIVVHGENLLVTDGEGSAIREVRQRDGQVKTLLGQAGEFTYGFADGDAKQARLQYPTDILVDSNDHAWILDAFNGRVRLLDLRRKNLSTPPMEELAEPAGFCLHEKQLWVANTNDHSLRKIDLDSKQGQTLLARAASE